MKIRLCLVDPSNLQQPKKGGGGEEELLDKVPIFDPFNGDAKILLFKPAIKYFQGRHSALQTQRAEASEKWAKYSQEINCAFRSLLHTKTILKRRKNT